MEFFNELRNLIPRRKHKAKKSPEHQIDAEKKPLPPKEDICDKTRVFKPVRSDKDQLAMKPICSCYGKISYKNQAGTVLLRELGSGRVNIGRIYENEISLRDAKVSRLHAFIVCENNVHILYDAQSTNGTYVNGAKITEHKLQNNDHIQIGNATLLYQQER